MAKKVWLIVGAVLVVIGLGLFLAVMAAHHWDLSALGVPTHETTYQVKEEFQRIQIDTDTADIVFVPSADGTCSVICDETAKETYSVSVVNDTLLIQHRDTRKWYEFFGFRGKSRLIVHLPKQQYVSLLIGESTGDVEIPGDFSFDSISITASTGRLSLADVSAGEINLAVSTGRVALKNVRCAGDVRIGVSTGRTELENVTCRNLTSTGSTGRIEMKNVIASGKLSVERSTGDVKLDRCDAAEIRIETSTGDVTGTLLSEKIFFTDTDTGSVRVPKTTTGGTCEITTDTGDIILEIVK
ncbi:MAG: DUF4097 family beta strand repeat protein [Oscillospiraceae bacterium]|nr:DUF4097 family beta strand repeat protein [Oscillospiraceae bacterium]